MTPETPGPQSPEYDAPERGEQVESFSDDVDYATEKDSPEPTKTFAEPDWDPTQPIPVYIAGRADTPEIVKWSSNRAQITDRVAQLSGSRRNRTRLVFQNEGSGAIFISPDPTFANDMSYRLNVASNYTIEMLHSGPVYAKTAVGDSATISWFEEYTVSLDEDKET